ncbi:hypothetical protein DVB69_10255 [Sporosarcina sp. BI001-red]|uniref:HMA2 domain-containing protein n=1 Tax=Sporosarcina sp. BI001-red TaxID=2282866 RepID=UPI000E24F693|nr:hypothetical protein [Sporosarcina sp. BI001-red]REB07222.1 hypothetical protein DVB69_10255 [Sporosarcina sp. BI001-red]
MMNTMIGFGATMITPSIFKRMTDQKVTVLHASPGRLRLQCDKWKNVPTSTNLQMAFRKVAIVQRSSASPITGSLLLEFTTPTLTQEQFDTIVQYAVEVSAATYQELPSSLETVLKNTVSTVDHTLKRQSAGSLDLDAILSVALLFGGISKLPVNPAFGASMLYWAYSLITNKSTK